MSRAILVTGATGNQGGAVVDALLSRKPSDFLLLAVTRDAKSPSAQSLAAKSPSLIRLVEGDLDSTARLFESAKQVAGTVPLWGVYSVQVSMGKGVTLEGEIKQGKAMIDESIKAGVQHFVYSSVERGGDERSWDNPTPVPHFKTKHEIEHYLRDTTARKSMGWTILRPVIFMDNLVPGFPGKVFMTMLRDTIKDKPIQWIATKDIGFFAAEAFHDPKTWNKRAVGLTGDVLTFSQLSDTFQRVTGRPAGTTFSLLGKALKHGVAEMGLMVDWFRDEGYGADMAKIEKVHPNVTKMETWLKNSAFVNSK
ncbi:hypothetical protein BFJ63_vAg9048 [Fusarium oxysporum f. sp. narcissi]|uniref:NmrA-like domain-containing protein n=2 Tax=Fusarium oxysporum TaxID=5507 RepID=A0A4Q2VNS9_FUSOX|nr:uncharacterized protein FOBCDRAFT_130091 [Fusarium oxysporum Fo47]EWZ43404.1 hypothetical protein FOZG_04514 [Fusarium oxysporum Fo47]QKD50510.1 hypothetical protein FOBCDRAFT_130091 [Fusarium oxysporum Fo47]RYC88192.1 hypothetical protein BFJ63_vAg9048 [Fusarium oxysporum f. sp. narcissi]